MVSGGSPAVVEGVRDADVNVIESFAAGEMFFENALDGGDIDAFVQLLLGN